MVHGERFGFTVRVVSEKTRTITKDLSLIVRALPLRSTTRTIPQKSVVGTRDHNPWAFGTRLAPQAPAGQFARPNNIGDVRKTTFGMQC